MPATVYTLTSLAARPRTTPDWVIQNLLKRRNKGFLIGQPKRACKSWLLLNMAWDLSEGKPLWGISHSKTGALFIPPRPLTVVYFSQEDAEDDIQDRMDLIIRAGRVTNDRVFIVPKDLSLSVTEDSGRKSVRAHLAGLPNKPDLILLDPMRRFHTGDENSSENMVKLWHNLDLLLEEFDCSAFFAHHIIKPPTKADDVRDKTSPYNARGSGDIYGAGDCFAMVVPALGRPPADGSHNLRLYFETKRGPTPPAADVSVSLDTGLVTFKKLVAGPKTGPE